MSAGMQIEHCCFFTKIKWMNLRYVLLSSTQSWHVVHFDFLKLSPPVLESKFYSVSSAGQNCPQWCTMVYLVMPTSVPSGLPWRPQWYPIMFKVGSHSVLEVSIDVPSDGSHRVPSAVPKSSQRYPIAYLAVYSGGESWMKILGKVGTDESVVNVIQIFLSKTIPSPRSKQASN